MKTVRFTVEKIASMSRSRVTRGFWRVIALTMLVASSLLAVPSHFARVRAATTNPIVLENQQPGSDQWRLNLPGFQQADDAAKQVKGYAGATSVNKDQPISFYITVNPAQPYTIDVYRMGWYQGKGGRLLQHIGALAGVAQPACPVDATTGLIACPWTASYTLNVPSDWTSGIYLALLTNAQNYQNYIIFTVRDDARSADLLYQQSVTTHQAYNGYPAGSGKSLYNYNSYGANTISGEKRAVKVSFDRPYAYNGVGDFLDWEIYFVHWLERSGYDVAYSTDLDTHVNGSRLRTYKGFLSVGHDEYWSKPMYDAAMAARDAGVNLAFFGADAVYWQIRMEPSASGVADRVIVCYKNASIDPIQGPTTTVLWRDPLPNRPEQTLIGVQYTSNLQNNGNAAYVVSNSSHWVYAGTGFHDGDSVPGLVGYEADRSQSNYPRPSNTSYTLLSNSPYTSSQNQADSANAVIYQAPSGAWVFDAGTVTWSWGLDKQGYVDGRIQQTTANLLNRFIPPSAPSSLSATAVSSSQINLSWIDNASTEDSYVVERSTDSSFVAVIGVSLPANASSYADTSLSDNTTYYYRVKAMNAGVSSQYSNTASATTQAAIPGAPASPNNLSAIAVSSSQIDLSWTDNANNEDNFIVERSVDSSFASVTSITLAANTISYSDTSVNPATMYYYRVKDTNTGGNSGYSNTASATTPAAPPNAPSNLSATRSGSTKTQRINLSWTDNSNNEINFLIERSTTNTFTSNLVTYSLPANTVSYSDTAVQRSTTYYYRVKAINSVGSSTPSNVASATTR